MSTVSESRPVSPSRRRNWHDRVAAARKAERRAAKPGLPSIRDKEHSLPLFLIGYRDPRGNLVSWGMTTDRRQAEAETFEGGESMPIVGTFSGAKFLLVDVDLPDGERPKDLLATPKNLDTAVAFLPSDLVEDRSTALRAAASRNLNGPRDTWTVVLEIGEAVVTMPQRTAEIVQGVGIMRHEVFVPVRLVHATKDERIAADAVAMLDMTLDQDLVLEA